LDRSELRVEVWPLERVVPYAKNPRVISSAAIEKVASSIKQFGLRQPIVSLSNKTKTRISRSRTRG
jgi:ParB-like chromosome segregation protein Spo0J